MKATIKYFLSNITAKNQKLAVKQILVDKPWALIDSEGEIQKLIFKDDNGLILSKNGKVVTGTWEYFPNSRALFIDRGTDKILLQDQYIDENILLLKRDGTDDDFFALANEHVIPDYNVENYLRSHVYNEIEMETRQEELDSGDILVIEQGTSRFSDENCKVSHFTKEFKNISLPDGRYFSKDHSTIYVIENQIIRKIIHNQPLKSYSGEEYFIEDLTSTNLMESINHPIFHPKQPLINATIQYSSSTFILVSCQE
jgi:hypothetical protein